jgi:hypothetical protein
LKRYADGIFGDYRRAAAIIAHHARGDGDGVNAILADAANHKRCSELVIAILGLYELAVPHITDDNVIATIQQLALTWAQTENQKEN